jgi:CysZ protein
MDTVIAFYQGLRLPLQAARVITKSRKLFVLSTLPLGVSLALTFLTGSALHGLIQGGAASLGAGLGLSLTGWVGNLVSGVATLIAVILGAILFTGFTSLVATPFNDFLAEASEPAAGLGAVPPLRLGLRLKLIWLDAVKSAAALLIVITATAFSWVPVLNLLGFTLAAFAIAFQYITYPQTRRNLGLKSSLGFLKDHPASCFGFGVAYGFLFSIPVISAFVIPLAVVGGTLLYGEKSEKSSEH